MTRAAALAAALVLALAGCPGGDSGEAATAPALAPGQRYRLASKVAGVEQALKVVSVEPHSVTYEVTATVGGKAGPSGPLVLQFGRLPRTPEPAGVTRPVVVGGVVFDCLRVEREGLTYFLAVEEGGALRFPGVVRIESPEGVSWELVALEAGP